MLSNSNSRYTFPKNQRWNNMNSSNIWSNDVFIIRQNLRKIGSYTNLMNRNFVFNHEETSGLYVTWHFKKTFYQELFIESDILLEVYVPKHIGYLARNMLSVMVSEQNVSGIYQQPQLYIFPGLFYILGLTKTVAIRKAKSFASQCSYKSKDHYFPDSY